MSTENKTLTYIEEEIDKLLKDMNNYKYEKTQAGEKLKKNLETLKTSIIEKKIKLLSNSKEKKI